MPVAAASVEIAGGEDSALWQMARLQSRLGLGSALRARVHRSRRLHQVAVCKGKHAIWLEAGDWQETPTAASSRTSRQRSSFTALGLISASDFGSVEVAWRSARRRSGHAHRAWDVTDAEVVADGVVEPDGRFTVKIDAPDVYLLAFDSANRLSTVGSVGVKDSTVNLELIPTES